MKTSLSLKKSEKCFSSILCTETTSSPAIEIFVYTDAAKLPTSWLHLASMASTSFLDPAYLQILENANKNIHYTYLILHRNSVPVGIFLTCLYTFKAEDSFKELENTTTSILDSIQHAIKKSIIKAVEVRLIAIGNLFLTGEHGYFLHPSLHKEEQKEIIKKITPFLYDYHKTNKKKANIVLVKEFTSPQEQFLEDSFHSFKTEPNMVLTIPNTWNSIEDYKQAISSKYRVKYNKTLSKLNPITSRELTLQEIEIHSDKIHELYNKVVHGSSFKLLDVQPSYWIDWKRKLPQFFQLVGYFLGDELIAFYTLLKNKDQVEAHYIGYDATNNASHALYLNMLFNMIQKSIEWKATHLHFARTSTEIKSSVGAVPITTYCYIKHQCKLSHEVVTQIINYLNPSDKEYTIRHPFK